VLLFLYLRYQLLQVEQIVTLPIRTASLETANKWRPY
jgi:hypothetical protein